MNKTKEEVLENIGKSKRWWNIELSDYILSNSDKVVDLLWLNNELIKIIDLCLPFEKFWYVVLWEFTDIDKAKDYIESVEDDNIEICYKFSDKWKLCNIIFVKKS